LRQRLQKTNKAEALDDGTEITACLDILTVHPDNYADYSDGLFITERI
jgi:hypothetical protein